MPWFPLNKINTFKYKILKRSWESLSINFFNVSDFFKNDTGY